MSLFFQTTDTISIRICTRFHLNFKRSRAYLLLLSQRISSLLPSVPASFFLVSPTKRRRTISLSYEHIICQGVICLYSNVWCSYKWRWWRRFDSTNINLNILLRNVRIWIEYGIMCLMNCYRQYTGEHRLRKTSFSIHDGYVCVCVAWLIPWFVPPQVIN